MKKIALIGGVLALCAGSFAAGYFTHSNWLFGGFTTASPPKPAHAAQGTPHHIYCHILPDGGDFTAPTFSWAVTPDGTLFAWPSYERSSAKKINEKEWAEILRDMMDADPKQRVQVSVHDPRVSYGTVIPFIRQVQDAGQPFLYFETKYAFGSKDDGNSGPDVTWGFEDVRCLMRSDATDAAATKFTVTISQLGSWHLNGKAVNHNSLAARFGAIAKLPTRSVIYIVPEPESQFMDVVEVMWLAKSMGIQSVHLDGK